LYHAFPRRRTYIRLHSIPGGLILSIDGIQPDKGNETVYLVRDVLSTGYHKSLYLLEYIDSPPLRQNVQRALNRGENYHQLRGRCRTLTSGSCASRPKTSSSCGTSVVG
jgi:hypothetical protein